MASLFRCMFLQALPEATFLYFTKVHASGVFFCEGIWFPWQQNMVIYLFEDLDFQNVRMLCVASAYSKYVLHRYD